MIFEKRAILSALGLAALAIPAWGQLAVMERTPGHERLDFMVGEWSHEGSQTILGQQATIRSSSRYEWLPGGVWLRGEATIKGLPGIDVHHGWLQLTFDAMADEYVQLWYDNQSSLLFEHRGGWANEKTLVMDGSHEWDGKTIYSRNVYRLVSASEYTREHLSSADGGETYERRSLAHMHRRSGSTAENASDSDRSVNAAFDALQWLVGDWQAQFRPHGEDQAAPTMAFEWGDENRSYLRMTGTQPTPDGRLIPEYESMVIWHPVRSQLVFLGVYRSSAGRVVEDGEIDLLEDGSVRLNMHVHYPAGATVPFSEGAIAGPQGQTLEFRRTFHRDGEDGLRGVFRIKRGEAWQNPHPQLKLGDGYPWRRVDEAAPTSR